MQVTQWEVERYLEAFQAVGAVAVALARHPAGGGPQRVKGHEARYPHSGRAADWGIGRRDRAALCIAEAPPRCDEASQAERRVNDLERFFWANTGGTIRAWWRGRTSSHGTEEGHRQALGRGSMAFEAERRYRTNLARSASVTRQHTDDMNLVG